MYLARLEAGGGAAGDFPVTGYFWSKAAAMAAGPLAFVCAMALTFEQANLDHTLDSEAAALAAGDAATAAVIRKVRADERGHVAFGWTWLARLKEPGQSMWQAYRTNLIAPLGPALARGARLNLEDRRALGMEEAFLAELAAWQARGPARPAAKRGSHGHERDASPGGLIHADLLAEQRWSAASQGLSRRGLAFVAASAGLMRVAARTERDEIWLPVDADEAGWASFDGLPTPGVRPAGDVSRLAVDADLLAWSGGPTVARPRPRRPRGPVPTTGVPWPDQLWRLGPADPEVTRRVNHKAWALALGKRSGLGLADALMIRDSAGLASWLAEFVGQGGGRWVLKAPWSAAGRDRYFGQGASTDAPGLAAWLAARLSADGAVIAEPWMDRRADFGCVGLVGDGTWRIVGVHALSVSPGGQFQGLTLHARVRRPRKLPDLAPAEASELERAMCTVAPALQAEGYRGAFGIDAWRYVDNAGTVAFNALGEVNARWTMGLVARAWVDRLVRLGHLDGNRAWRLHFGSLPVAADLDPAAVVLTRGLSEGAVSAWLEPAELSGAIRT